jgi:hypothetical protein
MRYESFPFSSFWAVGEIGGTLERLGFIPDRDGGALGLVSYVTIALDHLGAHPSGKGLDRPIARLTFGNPADKRVA